jgi:hypothetical protein
MTSLRIDGSRGIAVAALGLAAAALGPAAAALGLAACKLSSSPPGSVTVKTEATCTGDDSGAGGFCLSGSVDKSAFTAPIAKVQANLYQLYPSGGSQAIVFQVVDPDGKWAFSNLVPGLQYYLQIAIYFGDAGTPSFFRLYGPFTAAAAGAPVALSIKPVELDVLQSGAVGGAMTVSWARAHVFDPSTGSEITGDASVAMDVAGVPTSLPWDPVAAAYIYNFPTPPAAQPTYTFTTQASAAATPMTFQLVANPPDVDGGITAPDAGSSPSGSQPIAVGWTPEPVDYVSLELFENEGTPDAAVWDLVYPVADDEGDAIHAPAEAIGTISIDGGFAPGQYLLNVDFENSNCPATADGCVAAASAAAEGLTLSP